MPREDEQEEEYSFENESVTVKCKFCQTVGPTYVSMQPSVLTFICIIFITTLLGLLVALILFAPLMVITGLKVHKCRQCNNVLGKSKKILNQVEFLEDKVHSLAFGELAFVISRRLIINILASICVLLFIIWRLFRMDPVMGSPNNDSWEKFRDHCGNSVFRRGANDITSIAGRCQYNYIGSTFQNWKGYVVKINDNRSNYFDFFHSLKIQLKMEPEDNINSVDLVLDVNFDKSKLLRNTLERLDVGQAIMFNATLKGLHLTSPNHLHLVNLEVLNDYKEIPDIVITNSRFTFDKTTNTKSKLFSNKGDSATGSGRL